MMDQHNPSSSRADRKTIERNRRNQMKVLYSKLNSLVPHQSSREATSLPDQLDEAANYIKRLQTRLEKMKEKKNNIMGIKINEKSSSSSSSSSSINTNTGASGSAKIEITEMGSALHVVLITGLDFKYMLQETIKVLLEEEAEIVNASFSVLQNHIFHTIHAMVGESPSDATRVARISERLNTFVDGSSVYAYNQYS